MCQKAAFKCEVTCKFTKFYVWKINSIFIFLKEIKKTNLTLKLKFGDA